MRYCHQTRVVVQEWISLGIESFEEAKEGISNDSQRTTQPQQLLLVFFFFLLFLSGYQSHGVLSALRYLIELHDNLLTLLSSTWSLRGMMA